MLLPHRFQCVRESAVHQNRHKYEWVIGGPEEMAEVDDGLYSLIKMIKRKKTEESLDENIKNLPYIKADDLQYEEEDDLIDSDDTFTIKLRHVSSPES